MRIVLQHAVYSSDEDKNRQSDAPGTWAPGVGGVRVMNGTFPAGDHRPDEVLSLQHRHDHHSCNVEAHKCEKRPGDELGISEASTARPLQAAFTSALTFTAGAAAPLLAVALAPASLLVPTVAAVSLACLVVLGALGARAGRAPLVPSLLRVTFWGALAMVVTAGVGRLFGTTVG